MDPTKAIYNLVASFVRTIVPGVVSGVVGYLASRWGIIVDKDTQANLILLLTGVLFGLYYFLVRVAETYLSPRFAWFLGDFRKGISAPVYPKAVETIVIPPRDPGSD
jgi:hypothetical protein